MTAIDLNNVRDVSGGERGEGEQKGGREQKAMTDMTDFCQNFSLRRIWTTFILP
jgi:hypothetical protein